MLKGIALAIALSLSTGAQKPAACSASTDRSGCCSWHGGVCGCNGGTGMQRCCDGSDSPSCRCGD